MRVALITDGIWPYVLGGMQKHSYYLCKYLAQNKIYVDLFHFNRSTYDIQALEVFTDKERKFITSHIVDMPKSLPFPGHYIYNSYRHSKRIFDKIKDNLDQYDFIYTKGFAGWYLIEQKHAGKLKSAPIGVKFHGYEMYQTPPDWKTRLQHRFLLREPVRLISQKADLVFSYGGKITEIVKSLGVKEEQIVEIPSGVERSTLAEEIRPMGAHVRFLYLGRYERRKGVEELNKAINPLFTKDKDTSVHFSFIGPIPKSKMLKHRFVRYYGEIRNKQKLQNLIQQHDVLVCPSWSEGMPNVVLEAMANGLAIIATDVGANRVVVGDDNGWLVDAPSPEKLKHVLQTVMAAPRELINSKKARSLQKISEFTWEKLIHQFNERVLGIKA